MSAFKKQASSGGGDFSVPPAGNHPAVLVALVDLGTHSDTYQGKTTENQKLFLVWELTGEQDPATGKNFVVGRDYTNSLNEKAALRKLIEAWRGKALGDDEEFDYTKLLNKPCLITLVHKKSGNGNDYAKIDAVGQMPKGMKAPPAATTPLTWEVGDDPAKLPDWLPYVYGVPVREKVMASREIKDGGGVAAAAPAGGGDADEIGF